MLRTETLSVHHSHRTLKGIIQLVIISFFPHTFFFFISEITLFFQWIKDFLMVIINTKVNLEVQVVGCNSARHGRINFYNY